MKVAHQMSNKLKPNLKWVLKNGGRMKGSKDLFNIVLKFCVNIFSTVEMKIRF